MPTRSITTLALAAPAYLGYYALHDPLARAWAYYVATGLLMAWLAWLARPSLSGGLGAFAVTYILIESAQQAVCGALAWGMLPTGRDVCSEIGGETLYAAAGALLLAAAWTWRADLWPSRQPRK